MKSGLSYGFKNKTTDEIEVKFILWVTIESQLLWFMFIYAMVLFKANKTKKGE